MNDEISPDENDSIEEEIIEEIVNAEVDDDPGMDKPLLPRQRKLAELAAQGLKQVEIAERLHYSPTRVSILLKNPQIAYEVHLIRERMFEESVMGRLKKMADPALNVIEDALTDRRNRYKKSEQIDVSKWVLEKLDGKPTQKIDHGSSVLGTLLDRLDAMKSAGRTPSGDSFIDVTPRLTAPTPAGEVSTKEPEEGDDFADWVTKHT